MPDQELVIVCNKQNAEWSRVPIRPDLVLELFANSVGFSNADAIDIGDRGSGFCE
jgi:hypothetical protein